MLSRITHITLALWLFVISTGAPLFRHFCMERVKHMSLFAKAVHTCQPVQKTCSLHKTQQKQGIQRKKCCQDRVDYLKFNTDSNTSDYSILHPDIIAILLPLPTFEVAAVSTELMRWAHYRPPPLTRAIHIWVQAFLC